MPQRFLQTVTRLCAPCLLVQVLTSACAHAGDLLVEVEGRHGEASLYLALVAAEQPHWQPLLRTLRSEEALLRLDDLPPGRYAIQLFQDNNGNGQLDLSPRGLPLEPVGFSGNPALLRGKPTPLSSAFEHGRGDTRLHIRLQAPRPAKHASASPSRAAQR